MPAFIISHGFGAWFVLLSYRGLDPRLGGWPTQLTQLTHRLGREKVWSCRNSSRLLCSRPDFLLVAVARNPCSGCSVGHPRYNKSQQACLYVGSMQRSCIAWMRGICFFTVVLHGNLQLCFYICKSLNPAKSDLLLFLFVFVCVCTKFDHNFVK